MRDCPVVPLFDLDLFDPVCQLATVALKVRIGVHMHG